MNQINNKQNTVMMPLSLNMAAVVVDIIDGWNVIQCRICEKNKKRAKFADHFAKHFSPEHESPMTVQEIMNLVVPQIELQGEINNKMIIWNKGKDKNNTKVVNCPNAQVTKSVEVVKEAKLQE